MNIDNINNEFNVIDIRNLYYVCVEEKGIEDYIKEHHIGMRDRVKTQIKLL